VKINVKISLRLDLGIPSLSQTARKDGAPALLFRLTFPERTSAAKAGGFY
jgi:hypothetical protein